MAALLHGKDECDGMKDVRPYVHRLATPPSPSSSGGSSSPSFSLSTANPSSVVQRKSIHPLASDTIRHHHSQVPSPTWRSWIHRNREWEKPASSSSSTVIIRGGEGVVKFDKSLVVLLLLIETIACGCIIYFIPYTEIDWRAYMEEVEFFQNGERDYYKMKGNTGPLVYPAGFVYIFTILRMITGGDHGIGQIIFAVVYLVQMALVLLIAQPTSHKNTLLLSLVILSKRLHSIYLLRCFNDGVAMTFTFASIYSAQRRQWIITCILFSLGLSVKMNVLFFFPGLLWLLYDQASNHRVLRTVCYLFVCVLLQLILGLPFLMNHPKAYLHKAFEFGRVFQYKWTVNWKFIPESIFLSPAWSILLALGHATVLLAVWKRIWIRNRNLVLSKEVFQTYVAFVFYTSNFIGIFFCRSLHYQFYSWYFPTIPFLLCYVRGYQFIKILLLALLEYCWNVYPQRALVSLLLFIVHSSLLIGLVTSPLKDFWRREFVAQTTITNPNGSRLGLKDQYS